MRRRTPWMRALATTLAAALLSAGGSTIAATAAVAAPTPAAAPAGTFRNPVGTAADPFMTYSAGQYYLIETGGDNTVWMRHSASLGRLLASPAQPIWTETNPGRNRDIWAPVFVNLADHWYVYYAADNGDIGSHRMQVLESDATVSAGATPLGTYHFNATLQDPSSGYFGIDGVPFLHNGNLYFVWAAGYCCGFDRLRIAPMANPYTLTGTSYEMPVDICDAVAEAPATLHRNGRTFLTYSVCDTGKPDYQLKMLSIGDGADPMNAGNWRNHGTVFTRNNAAGTYSVGSNGFFTSPDGSQDWIAYQAKNTGAAGDNTYAGRDTRVQSFTWNADGTPHFGTPVGVGDSLSLPTGDPGPAPTVINNSETGTSGSSSTGPIRGPGTSGKCIDVAGDDTATTGAAVQIWNCLNVTDQQWTTGSDGALRSMGKCMDVEGYGTANFSKVHLWDCHGGANQQWQIRADGSILNPVSGRCLDDNAGNTANGVQLQLYDCNGQWPQTWQTNTSGSSTNRVSYAGAWTTGSSCGNQCYQGDDSYTSTPGDTATITFTGRQIILLSVKDVGNGIAGISIDGAPETTADFYGPVRDGQRVQYVSPMLNAGTHTLRLRNTGNHNPASNATYIGFDRAEIYP